MSKFFFPFMACRSNGMCIIAQKRFSIPNLFKKFSSISLVFSCPKIIFQVYIEYCRILGQLCAASCSRYTNETHSHFLNPIYNQFPNCKQNDISSQRLGFVSDQEKSRHILLFSLLQKSVPQFFKSFL